MCELNLQTRHAFVFPHRKCRAPGTVHFTFIELKGATGKWIENKLYHPHWNDKAAMSTSHKSLISQPYIFRCNYSCATRCLRQRVRMRDINFSAVPINSRYVAWHHNLMFKKKEDTRTKTPSEGVHRCASGKPQKETHDSVSAHGTCRLSPWEGNAHLELDLQKKQQKKKTHTHTECEGRCLCFSKLQVSKTQCETCGARAGARASAPVRVCFEFKCSSEMQSRYRSMPMNFCSFTSDHHVWATAS